MLCFKSRQNASLASPGYLVEIDMYEASQISIIMLLQCLALDEATENNATVVVWFVITRWAGIKTDSGCRKNHCFPPEWAVIAGRIAGRVEPSRSRRRTTASSPEWRELTVHFLSIVSPANKIWIILARQRRGHSSAILSSYSSFPSWCSV